MGCRVQSAESAEQTGRKPADSMQVTWTKGRNQCVSLTRSQGVEFKERRRRRDEEEGRRGERDMKRTEGRARVMYSPGRLVGQ
jgi:hypothetical protein